MSIYTNLQVFDFKGSKILQHPFKINWLAILSSSLSDSWLQHIDLFENIKFGTNLFHFKINWLYEESDRLLDTHWEG